MEDFESRMLSPELLNINSNSRLKFRSPVASIYSDISEEMHNGWSPPPWRKHGTGWYNHTSSSGLRSPPRSRETSPLLRDAYLEEEDEPEDDTDDADVLSAARIALPESPVKGRSEEPSMTPEVIASAARATHQYLTPPSSFEAANNKPQWNSDNNCEMRTQRTSLVCS